jgi:hypothetical protein
MKCQRCDHDQTDHCKGSKLHSALKDEGRVESRQTLCTTRHCLMPLCSCVEFVPAVRA